MNRGSKVLKILLIFAVLGMIAIVGVNSNTQVEAASSTTTTKTKSVRKLKIVVNHKKYYIYTGTPVIATVKVFDGSKKLKENRDYTLAYSKNNRPGKAKVVVYGIGKYSGWSKDYFYIAPKKATIKSVTFNSSFTKATIKWEKDKKASGYKIYMSETKDGEYVKVKNISSQFTTSYTKKGLDPNKMYYFKVRAYVNADNKQIARQMSSPKSNTGLVTSVTLNSPRSGENRNHNLWLACNTINGTVLRPGETFDWFKVVGQASDLKGYRVAIVYQGTQSVLGSGGGVCQVSTTLYQASRNMGLQIVERHQHSKPVSYTTLGNDATVYYGAQNLKIRNNKGYSVKLVMSASGGSTTCKIYRVY